MLTLTTGPFAAIWVLALPRTALKRIGDNKTTMTPKVGKVIAVMSQILAVAPPIYQSHLKSHRIVVDAVGTHLNLDHPSVRDRVFRNYVQVCIVPS